MLARSAGDRFDAPLIERIGGDREALAEVVEQIDERLAAPGRARSASAVVCGELIKRNIIGPYQPKLFQVRVGDRPPSPTANRL